MQESAKRRDSFDYDSMMQHMDRVQTEEKKVETKQSAEEPLHYVETEQYASEMQSPDKGRGLDDSLEIVSVEKKKRKLRSSLKRDEAGQPLYEEESEILTAQSIEFSEHIPVLEQFVTPSTSKWPAHDYVP